VTIRIGYAAGAFDLFHIGHLNLLKHARSACDFLIAGVVSDEMLESAKGRPPVVPLVERLEIVRHISFVDRAHAETLPDKLDTWEALRFDVFFKGDDWRGTDQARRLEQRFAEVGVEVVYFPYTLNTSSTVLRRALEALASESDGPSGATEDMSAISIGAHSRHDAPPADRPRRTEEARS